ncbi:MAG: HD domain-containing protein [Pyrinomonadaceae bacterium]|nr:HD domain-containing protein [Pyrinomonadaceae bacterium]MCX7639734.1 HD domain-containing protein [Pyrinomonadaceae bacterium]MDW8304317.1 HD domain-containing protein [Acidobacteriota bacterium]
MSERLFEKVILIAESVRKLGGRALLVGGCVRDELMGFEPKDYDVEVYGLKAEELYRVLESIFGEVKTVGASFAVYKVDKNLDVSLPRRERKIGRGHRGFLIEGDPFMSFEEASRRRDFTMNAILKDPLNGEIIDPFHGREDISRRIIRHISDETFPEDSLRVLRACQFAARFEFHVAEETVKLCQQIDLSDLPNERIWGEIEKLLLQARRPSIGLEWMKVLGVNRQLFPELEVLVGVPQDPEWHPEGDVWTHTLMVVDEARKLIDDLEYPKKVTVMLAALCHDLGKAVTTEFIDGRWRSLRHDEEGAKITEKFLDKLGIFTLQGYPVKEKVVQLVKYHLKPGEFYKRREEIGDGAFRRLAQKVELELLYRVAKADSLGRNPDWLPKERRFSAEAQEWFIQKARELQVEMSAPKPILMGRHLIEIGLKPSPLFGKILNAVYQKQLDGEVKTLDEAIQEARSLIVNIEDLSFVGNSD